MELGALVRVGPKTSARLAEPILLSLESRDTLKQKGRGTRGRGGRETKGRREKKERKERKRRERGRRERKRDEGRRDII